MPENYLDVHIALADEGWVLERLAREIASRHSGITVGTEPRASATIQYYVNYSARRQRISEVEMAFFTHSELAADARQKFFQTAHDVDQCICMSSRYAEELAEDGVEKISTIVPGVDFDTYRPMLRIGVVGRTYHSGRKGERLIKRLMDLKFIDWYFTGEGWPLPGKHPENYEMGDFYRSMDYILVPAEYEGGPMCVLEALSCGTPVIAPPVGWVEDYPHISYPTGDEPALRKLLGELFEQKRSLAKSVDHHTWDKWASDHINIMQALMPNPKGILNRLKNRHHRQLASGCTSVQILHGTERASRGGPSTRVPRTAELLGERSVSSCIIYYPDEDMPACDIAHLYNIWPPQSALETAREARKKCKRLVFSPIFLNLSLRAIWDDPVRALVRLNPSPEHLLAAYRDLDERYLQADTSTLAHMIEPLPGYFNSLRQIIALADHVVCLSRFEAEQLRKICGFAFPHSVIRNPVDKLRWKHNDGASFFDRHGVQNYVLSVGRIEPRKNQLALALALKGADVPVVFIGGVGSAEYGKSLQSLLDDNMIWIDHLDHNSDELVAAYSEARLFVSTSWAEGASLSLLEAHAANLPLIVNDTGSEREYFEDHAIYVRPSDIGGIRTAILDAFKHNSDKSASNALGARFSWQLHISELSDLYAKLMRRKISKSDN